MIFIIDHLGPSPTGATGVALAGARPCRRAAFRSGAPDDEVFALPEVKRGLVAGGGGLLRLPRRLPYHVAMRSALTGAPLTATRAHAFGLVNEPAPPGGRLHAAVPQAHGRRIRLLAR
ncbi:enoyl-CoA hydratase-related protein [Streptomyces sp. SID3343]|uniref:enoyl-CoA hydratase-related protein n=1 Tax=Streptomyces sp. SID3343 TaxID=2690260 RepID=UPI0019267468|nr:enoyl-CoA hydratase-related protein [Streptomyces sp. SID3343]